MPRIAGFRKCTPDDGGSAREVKPLRLLLVNVSRKSLPSGQNGGGEVAPSPMRNFSASIVTPLTRALIRCLNTKTTRLRSIESIAFEFEFYIFRPVTPVVFGLRTKAGTTVGVTNQSNNQRSTYDRSLQNIPH
jgi:hypothetical protein